MATIKASVLVPGDKFYCALVTEHKDHKPGTFFTRYDLECVRTKLIPATLESPNIVAVMARDLTSNDKRWVYFGEEDQVVKIPKPGKWATIWKLLPK